MSARSPRRATSTRFHVREYAPLEEPAETGLWPLTAHHTLWCWLQEACAECPANDARRIDWIDILLHRPDGSPVDTVDVEVSVACPADGMTPCSGAGALRDMQRFELYFAEDVADGVDEVTTPHLALSGVLSDSVGAFVGLTILGARHGSVIHLLYDESANAHVADCEVWWQADTLTYWNDEVSATAGGPPVRVGFACDLGDTIVVPPCADECEFTNFFGLQAYFDPNTNIVYQWFDPGELLLPLQPQGLDFKLYFEALGAASDSAYLRALFACAGFGDVCCPPAEPVCSIPLSVRRGTAFQTVLDVHADISSVSCCLSEPFWLGIVVDSVTGGATLPSFLFSAASVDPNPPLPCEQWTGAAGALSAVRTDDVGWADVRLTGLCASCGGLSEQSCQAQPQMLDCEMSADVPCAEAGVRLENLVIVPGLGSARRYCCSDLSFPGAELIFRMQIPNQGNVAIRATTDTLDHVALFLLETCDPRQCVAFGRDSLFASDLTNGEYFVVVESWDGQPLSFDLDFVCIADCNHETCDADLRGPGGLGNRYLDGEGDGAGNVFYQSYYPGTNNTQYILRYDAQTCDSLPPITWQSQENSACRMLAYDPRNGGEFWCGTTTDFFTGTGRLYRLSSGGGVIQSWTALPGLTILRWSGAAFDPTHNHMWVFVRDSSNTGHSRAFELNLSNPLQPSVIQGPHVLPQQSPNQSLSCAGADYAHLSNHLLVVHQGAPNDFVQCYEDLDPGYDGPQPGPGFVPVAWCTPDSNSLQGYGVAAIEDTAGGKIAMTNFTDADWLHPVALYPPPCRLTPARCAPPDHLTVAIITGGTRLSWMATYPGLYDIYSCDDPENDGNPDGGQDTQFTLEASLPLPAGAAEWDDLHDLSVYRIYSIVLTCSTAVSQAGAP
ncbi:MAG: hypothetical protein IPK53_15250 [bacterium]|nr:hypothetical protein [bacterium]